MTTLTDWLYAIGIGLMVTGAIILFGGGIPYAIFWALSRLNILHIEFDLLNTVAFWILFIFIGSIFGGKR